jgi:predicted ATPase
MSTPHRLMLTGGPCAGKTTVLEAVRQTYGDHILLMPEVPTILMSNGYPRPGIDIAMSDDWFRSFQSVVLPFQLHMENQYVIMAQEKKIDTVLFDRGLIDGAAYMPGGEEVYLKTFDLSKEEAYKRYDMIIHLESVAACQPDLWESLKETNLTRYETLEQAQERDRVLQSVWGGHPHWHLVPGSEGIDHVVGKTLELIKPFVQPA